VGIPDHKASPGIPWLLPPIKCLWEDDWAWKISFPTINTFGMGLRVVPLPIFGITNTILYKHDFIGWFEMCDQETVRKKSGKILAYGELHGRMILLIPAQIGQKLSEICSIFVLGRSEHCKLCAN